MKYGALEAGGTKMVMAVFDDNGRMTDRQARPTGTPEDTMPGLIQYFREAGVDALGLGFFGPLDLRRDSPDYGSVTATPKLSWRNYPALRVFREALGIPTAIDTDVNAAALAEFRLGAGRGGESCLYLTVGTGIGGGLIVNGRPVHGLMHPEIGHIPLRPLPEDPAGKGFCPYHDGCAEGLAAGPAMEKRWGVPAKELPADHIGWRMEAAYLAQVCACAALSFSPEKIILGGGVTQSPGLLPLIREAFQPLINGYIPKSFLPDPAAYLVEPGLGVHSGITGAYLLARQAAEDSGDQGRRLS